MVRLNRHWLPPSTRYPSSRCAFLPQLLPRSSTMLYRCEGPYSEGNLPQCTSCGEIGIWESWNALKGNSNRKRITVVAEVNRAF